MLLLWQRWQLSLASFLYSGRKTRRVVYLYIRMSVIHLHPHLLSSQNWADSVVLNEMNRGASPHIIGVTPLIMTLLEKQDYVTRQNGCHIGTVKPRLLMYVSLWRQQVNFRQFSLFYKYQTDIIQGTKTKVGFRTKIFDL